MQCDQNQIQLFYFNENNMNFSSFAFIYLVLNRQKNECTIQMIYSETIYLL